MDIAARLKDIREQVGLAQRPFAARVSSAGFPISSAAVSGYESGRTGRIPADYVSVVCREFGWSPRWVLWGEGPEHLVTETDAHQRLDAVRRALGEPVGVGPRATGEVDAPYPEFAALIEALTGARGEKHGGSPVKASSDEDSEPLARERAVWAAFEGHAPGAAEPLPPAVGEAGEGGPSPSPARKLNAQGLSLHDEGDPESAAELHEQAYNMAMQEGDEEVAQDAALRLGRCRKLLTEWASAESWYQRGVELAESRRDSAGVALGTSALASLRFVQGSLPRARELAQRALRVCQEHSDTPTMVQVYHVLNQIEAESGDYRAALRYCWRAVELRFADEDSRARVIFSAGTSLLYLGHIDAAEDAYVIAALRIREVSTWILALSALTYTAAIRGESAVFDRRAKRLAEIAEGRAHRSDRCQILFHTAESLAFLGRTDQARVMFGAAITFAEASGLNKELIKAEKALRDLDAGRGPRRPVYVPPDDEIRTIHAELRRMREEAVAAGGRPSPAEAGSRGRS